MRERLFLHKYNGTEREGGSSIDQPKVPGTAQALHILLRILHTSYPAKHHTRLNRIARASSWPGANVILAGYSSSKSALMLDANHAEISPAVHRYVCTWFWFSIPRWNHYELNGVAYAEASLHAFWIARGRPEGLSFGAGKSFFLSCKPTFILPIKLLASRSSESPNFTFFSSSPKMEKFPRMISSYWTQITSFHHRRISISHSTVSSNRGSSEGGKTVYKPAFITIRSPSWP